jgi:hypothetical protein
MIVATVVRIAAMTVATAAMTATTAVADPGCCADSPYGRSDPETDGRLPLSGTTRTHRSVTR